MGFDEMFATFRISASGLAAERRRMDVIANNLANANTTAATRTADGKAVPFRKDEVVFRTVMRDELGSDGPNALGGVRVERIVKSDEPFRVVHRPGHPDADPKTGMLRMPNVNPVTEMVDLITASRAYQANLTVLTAFRQMMSQTLQLGR